MEKIRQAVMALARIPEDVLVSSSENEATDLAFQAVGDLAPEGIALRCAERASLAETKAIPCLIVHGERMIRSRNIPWGENAVLTMLDLDNGSLQCAPLFVPPANKIPPEEAKASHLPPRMTEARSLGIHWIDLRHHPGLSMSCGRHLLRVMCWDWFSNAQPLQVSLQGARPPSVSRRASHRLGNLARSGIPVSDQATASLSFSGSTETPMLRGILRIQAPLEWPPGVIRATLLIARHNVVAPVLIHLDIDAWDLGSSVRAASFELRLKELLPESLPIGEYQVYLLSADTLAGPYPIRL